MNCPKCKGGMSEIRKDNTVNPETKKKYSRTVYQCEKDDIWITVETPGNIIFP